VRFCYILPAVQIVAVDWSGAVSRPGNNMWLAVVADGRIAKLENGRNRTEVCRELLELAAKDPQTVVGLDFAFSLPSWFLSEKGLTCATDLWELAQLEGEKWLTECVPPFWGRGSTRRPTLAAHFRWTDMQIRVGGISPKSVFQIGGAGAVGTGSVRGWPYLRLLRQGGFHVWPFDDGALPVIIEMYPRLLTGPVVKSSAQARISYLAQWRSAMDPEHLANATASEDAFDAAVSALVMDTLWSKLASLPKVVDETLLMEGLIWDPDYDANHVLPTRTTPRRTPPHTRA
jgi:hypothetical protein